MISLCTVSDYQNHEQSGDWKSDTRSHIFCVVWKYAAHKFPRNFTVFGSLKKSNQKKKKVFFFQELHIWCAFSTEYIHSDSECKRVHTWKFWANFISNIPALKHMARQASSHICFSWTLISGTNISLYLSMSLLRLLLDFHHHFRIHPLVVLRHQHRHRQMME